MSHKELSAWVMVVSAAVVSAWVAWGLMTGGVAASPREAALGMLWAVGYSILLNIIAVIIGVIGVAIVTRHEVKDERADERDKLVNGMSMRNAYFVLSISVALALVAQAFWIEPIALPYVLFFASMLAGTVFAVSQIVYYRLG